MNDWRKSLQLYAQQFEIAAAKYPDVTIFRVYGTEPQPKSERDLSPEFSDPEGFRLWHEAHDRHDDWVRSKIEEYRKVGRNYSARTIFRGWFDDRVSYVTVVDKDVTGATRFLEMGSAAIGCVPEAMLNELTFSAKTGHSRGALWAELLLLEAWGQHECSLLFGLRESLGEDSYACVLQANPFLASVELIGRLTQPTAEHAAPNATGETTGRTKRFKAPLCPHCGERMKVTSTQETKRYIECKACNYASSTQK